MMGFYATEYNHTKQVIIVKQKYLGKLFCCTNYYTIYRKVNVPDNDMDSIWSLTSAMNSDFWTYT